MRTRLTRLSGLTALLVFALASAASAATTLGSTTPPSGATPVVGCGSGRVIAQFTSDPATPYAVPAGVVGQITDWSTNTSGAQAGRPVTLVVLAPAGGGDYSVVAADSETLPSPLPPSGVATFTLATPIAVTGGDTLGLYTTSGLCLWKGGATPPGDSLTRLVASSPPASGQTLNPATANTPPGYTMNVAATLLISQDAGVVAATAPTNATVGNLALLAATVTNDGPSIGPIVLTDTVPAGLDIVSAVAGSGGCFTAGQVVTCTIDGLAPGRSAPVSIVVRPTGARTFTNAASVAVAPGTTDPNPANDTASAKLVVAPAPIGGTCIVPRLAGTPLGIAKHLLRILGCKVGRIHRKHSATIPKGDVIRSVPRPRTYHPGTVVALLVSSGP